MIRSSVVVAMLVSACSAVPASGQSRKVARPAQLEALVGCRQVADAATRLACFDRQVAAIDDAEARSELVIVDRQQIRSTRRSLFGLTLPRIAFLEGDGKDAAPEEVEGKVKSFATTNDGKWLVQLDDALWRTTEVNTYQPDPKVGDDVKIRRAALGSFKLSIKGRSALRAVRVR